MGPLQNRGGAVAVTERRSDPARSTRWSFELVPTPSAMGLWLSTRIDMIRCERELAAFIAVAPVERFWGERRGSLAAHSECKCR